MSWRGFQKAITRLPQLVKQKTGLAEGTVDEDFKELSLTYTRVCQDTTKFLNECISYKAAMLTLLNFQVSLVEEHQWQLQQMTNGINVDKAVHDLQDLRTDMSREIDAQIDRLLIRPLTEYQLLLSKVENIIKKRNHKLLDYDRHRTALKKMTENTARKHEMSEEKRIIKQEQQVNYATMEYERYNNLLKVELPHLMELRAKLIEPGIETLISFQRMFYTKGAAIFSGAAFGSLTKTLPTTDAQHKYDAIVEPILRELRVMGLFHGTAQSTKMDDSPLSVSRTTDSSSSSDRMRASPPPAYAPVMTTTKREEDGMSERLERVKLSNNPAPNVNPPSKRTPPKTAKAIYDFASNEAEDLSFKAGDQIEVVDASDQYGWWVGKFKGKTGNFPSNYVTTD